VRRLFLDANVLFTAAHNPDGKSAFILSLGGEGAWEVYTSTLAVEEARRNLSKKYPLAEKKFNELLGAITIVPERSDSFCPDKLEEKDRPIFQAAYACGASHLITGDITHFGALMNKPGKTNGIIILTPALFLSSLQ